MSRLSALVRLAGAIPNWAWIAWWGLVSPRAERGTLRIVHAVIVSERGVLLAVRETLRGWELPGGHLRAGETDEQALLREVREETGLEVAIERRVGEYVRTGFRPHTACVFRCRVVSGTPRPSVETPRLAWFDPGDLPGTLFPWFRAPIGDALPADAEPVARRDHWGLRAILAGARIDLTMRGRSSDSSDSSD